MDFICEFCGHAMRREESEGYYNQFRQMYIEVYESKSQSKELQIEALKRKKNLLNISGRCSSCGSIFREYLCSRKHICTIFSLCPICGERTSTQC